MGFATAQLLAERGAILSLADLNEVNLEKAKMALPYTDRHMATVVDVRESNSVDAWIARTVKELGSLDGAVNMAGVITAATPIAEMTDDMWDFNFAVNAKGVFACIRAQVRAMSKGGSIVSIDTNHT